MVNKVIKWFNFDKKDLIGSTFVLLLSVLPFIMILAPIAMIIFCLTVLVCYKKDYLFNNLKINKRGVLLISYYLMIVISLFYSYDLGLKYSRIASQLPLFLLPFFLFISGVEKDWIHKAKQVFVLACFIFCLIGFSTVIYNYCINFEHRLNYNFIQRSMHHFHYPYDVLYLNIAYIFTITDNRFKLNKQLIIVVFLAFILLSGLRMGIFTFTLISILFFIKNFKEIIGRRFLVKLFFVLISAFILINESKYAKDKYLDTLSKIGFNTEQFVSEVGANYHNISVRSKLWNSSYDLFKTKPIFGFGPNGSQEYLEKMYNKKGYSNLVGLNSHNQFLTTVLNHGTVGLIILVFIFIVTFSYAIKNNNFQYFLCILTLFLAFNTESILVRQKGVFIFALIMALVIIDDGRKRI